MISMRASAPAPRLVSRLAVPVIALAALIPVLSPATAAPMAKSSPAAPAGAFYAFAHGGATSPSNCPLTAQTARECTLTQALALVPAAGSVLLANGGGKDLYFGNFSVATPGTSAAAEVSISPAPGVRNPIVSGDASGAVRCPTGKCDNAVLTVAAGVAVSISSITIRAGDNTSTGMGGGISDQGILQLRQVSVIDSTATTGGGVDVATGASLTARGSFFARDKARWGGGIANGVTGSGTLAVVRSTFAQDKARDGGAIDNGDLGGTGIATVTASTFSGDWAGKHGAAIDNGSWAGGGTATVLRTTIDGSGGSPAIDAAGGTVQIAGSIIAASAAVNCAGTISDAGYNLESDEAASCGFSTREHDLAGIGPGLMPLGRHGGPAPTMRPSPASPVLDQIPNPAVVYLGSGNRMVALCPAADQAGDPSAAQAFGCALGSDDPVADVPVVTALTFSQGPASGGTRVVIHGGNFAANSTVRFGTATGANMIVRSATKIIVTAPAFGGQDGQGQVPVTVTDQAGLVSPPRPGDLYTYYPADWSGYLGGPAHSSFNPAAVAINRLTVRNLEPIWQWQPPPSDNGGSLADYASPIVSDGVVYVGVEDGSMFAISEATQQVLWSRFLGLETPTTCPGTWGITSTATVADDPVTGNRTVYVNAPDGHLYALDADTGQVVWESVVGIPSAAADDYYAWGSPTVANGKVYVGISSNCDKPLVQAGVLAFAQHSGEQLAYWDSQPAGAIGGSVWSSVAVLPDGDVVATTGNSHGDDQLPNAESVVELDGSSLKLVDSWMVPAAQRITDSDFGGSPTVFTGYPAGVETTMVGACNKDGIYYAFRADDLHAGPQWEQRMGAPNSPGNGQCAAAAIWNGHDLIEGGGTAITINGVSYAGSVQALDPTTGQPVWQTGLPGSVLGSPALDGAGVIAAPIISSQAGMTGVYLLSARTGRILKFVATQPHGNFAQPVFDHDDLVIGNVSRLSLTAYAITRRARSAPLQVSPATVSPGATVTLTITGTGDFTAPLNVIFSGRVAEVESVQVDSPTEATVTINMDSTAPPGMALDLAVTEPDLTTYSCSSCLTVGTPAP